MALIRAGAYRQWVTLSRSQTRTNDDDGFYDDLDPPTAYCLIQPTLVSGERTTESVVEMRYHPGVTVDTRILYGTRALFVRAVQDVDEAHQVMRLLCEEIAP